MYQIHLDESYNLTFENKNQIMVLGGFGTSEAKTIAKKYKNIRKHILKPKQFGLEIKKGAYNLKIRFLLFIGFPITGKPQKQTILRIYLEPLSGSVSVYVT